MKFVQLAFILGVLALPAGAAAARSDSLNAFTPTVLPVLVQVDAHGTVTDVSPAVELAPKLKQLLRANVDEMISGPAIDTKGRSVSSQFIINLALQASPRPDGDYEVNFAYVSTSPVPGGSWYWVRTDGRQFTLASRHQQRNRGTRIPYQYQQNNSQRSNTQSSQPRINTATSPASAPMPVPASTPDPGKGG